MIPIPANIKLIVLIVLVGGIAALQAIEHLMPTWSWIGGTVQVLSVIEAYLTVRGSTLTELKALRAEAAKAAAAGAKIAGPIVVLLGLGALVTTETGCPAGVKVASDVQQIASSSKGAK